jgi:hypothetical protein
LEGEVSFLRTFGIIAHRFFGRVGYSFAMN